MHKMWENVMQNDDLPSFKKRMSKTEEGGR